MSSTKHDEEQKAKDDEVKIADISRSKWKKTVDHTTVATKRLRHRGAAVQERKSEEEEEERSTVTKPEFTKNLEDVSVSEESGLVLAS